MRLRISSRKSDLARIQAYSVGSTLKVAFPQLQIDYQFRESLGDQNQSDPLWKMPEKGVFTEDFVEDLLSEKTDLVVHSWKDLPTEKRSGTMIGGTLPRADERDLLLFRKDRIDGVLSSHKLKIFSSSPRRAYNLKEFIPQALPLEVNEVAFENVRGNVPTRIHKLLTQDIDGLVVAKAALDRLLTAEAPEFSETRKFLKEALQNCYFMISPLGLNPAAAAQGALALEVRENDRQTVELLRAIHCEKTFNAVSSERALLEELGGGCHQKIGITQRAFDFGQITYVRAFVGKDKINEVKFTPIRAITRATPDKIFPLEQPSGQWFKRENFDIKSLPTGPLWVARSEALPLIPGSFGFSRLVWVSGWETWKKLARRGLWINGCSEGLGEDLDPAIDAITDEKVSWTKLTHQEGFENKNGNTLMTYKLIPVEEPPSLDGKTHFFWSSGSNFLRALELNPWIKGLCHSCGPGHTRDVISKKLLEMGVNEKPFVFPSYEIWKEQVLK